MKVNLTYISQFHLLPLIMVLVLRCFQCKQWPPISVSGSDFKPVLQLEATAHIEAVIYMSSMMYLYIPKSVSFDDFEKLVQSSGHH